MRVLVNYSKEDKPHLGGLAVILRNMGITAMSTAQDLTIGELLGKARTANCNAILLCNEQTLRYCVPGEKPTLDKWRGTRLNFSVPTIILNRLEHIYTVAHGKWLLERDIGKLRTVLNATTPFSYTVLENTGQFPIALGELSRSIAAAYDIETKTFYPDGRVVEGFEESNDASPREVGKTIITCASWTGIYPDGILRTYTLPLVDFGVDHWHNDEDYHKAILLLRRINKLSIPKIMHNGMYDATHSICYHAEPLNWTVDTMALAHAQYSELPKSLDFVASYELDDYIFWKDDSIESARKKDIRAYWGYNAKDSWYTARLAIKQLRTAPAYAIRNYKEKFKSVYPSLYCNFEGFDIDQGNRLEIRKEAKVKLEAARARLRVKMADPNFNPGSWQQVEKYVYKVFGAKKPNIGKSKRSTDEKNLKSVAEQHPLLARLTTDILDYREAQKAIGTYFDFLQNNKRLLWAINPFGTETDRSSCTASSWWCGTQVQNVPPYAKRMLIADEGFELFEADNKQSEGRTTAYCAQDLALIQALENATQDFYKTLGTLFFGIPYEEVSKEFRNLVLKKIVHGTNYMMGDITFIENITVLALMKAAGTLGIKIVQVPRKNKENEMTLRMFAHMLLETYHKPFPRIRKWYKEIKNEVSTTGQLVSPWCGHVRKFFGDIEKDHRVLRGAVAHQPQNLSVRILDVGFNRIYNELVIPGNGDIRLKAQIHDSCLGQWRIGLRDYYARRVLECMNNPAIIHGRTLLIPVDIKIGRNWAEGNDKNPEGTYEWKGQ